MSKNVAIKIRNLKKSFRDGKDQVLKGVNLDFYEGELTYILGPSGVGKSVLLKHILGLMKPDSGEVWVGESAVHALKYSEMKQHHMQFGMLFQNAALFDDYTVFQNVAFPLWEHASLADEEITKKVTDKLSLLGMKQGLDKFPNELSGGMKKRVGLARAIIREPKVLLYDEPTTGLDPVTRSTVDELIETIKSNLHCTSLVISHDIPSALRLADRICFIYGGEIVFHGTPQELMQTPHAVIQSFLNAEKKSYHALQSV